MHADDAAMVARIHTLSWQTAYRGLYADVFLDEQAAANRAEHWRRRLTATEAEGAGLVAERSDVAIGFTYLIPGADPARGTLLDNLHVLPDERGRGTGTRLLVAAAREVLTRAWPAGLHLWVFEANDAARRFYARHGAREVERIFYEAADGGTYPALCYQWDVIAAAALAPGDDTDAHA